ncbi:hypothetical protein AAFF_G00238750 [Aldrovandia affinis]|uniref:Uncharacterized protein n=1 Tax=Aldrovandia affinis TaxID=143900 RepID=A0AAD7REU3_9TELE|nr:hypothetical protein AAFF_G00238750 [Aldrovandia affinis]
MFPSSALRFLWGLLLLLTLSRDGALRISPRKTVPYQEDHVRRFRVEGVGNYSIMLLQEDQGLLLVGAREAIYALDINDISRKKASANWEVTKADKEECTNKGKQADTDCQNYIRILHESSEGRVYVCGTNAFSPECRYMKYTEGQLTMEDKRSDGKGKCPFDPFQRYSSTMVDGDLYSATSNNFLGSEPVVMRSSPNPVRTEFKISWLNEPSFISMDTVPESLGSFDGDDDKVYLFFSETAVEYDSYNKLTVSRVARVCKGDLGGQRTLQKKWTSFLKARLDCPVPDSRLPPVVQDVFLLRHSDWRKSTFYAVFTPQQGSVDQSAVCAYSVSDIGEVFSQGKFKTPVTVATSHVWVMYSEDLPEPRPGACINNASRALGVKQSLDLPDKTLRFIKDRPLMDQAVRPVGGGPQLVEKGATFTRIVVDYVQALDGQTHHVMFIGTEDGFVQKAVNYDGDMVVIEEVQLFQAQEPIRILRLSSALGLLYAGSDSGVVQMTLSACERHTSCLDCVLSRDPHCAWDPPASRCTTLPSPPEAPDPGSARPKPENVTLIPGSTVNLPCRPASNLAQVRWTLAGRPLPPSPRYYTYREGLMLLNASAADAGAYACLSEEHVKGRLYRRTEAEYQLAPGGSGGLTTPRLEAQRTGPSLAALQASVALLTLLLVALLAWNLYRGHLPLPCGGGPTEAPGPKQAPPGGPRDPGSSILVPEGDPPESKPLMTPVNYSANNNLADANASSNGERSLAPRVTMDTLQFIDDESEI